HIQTELVAKVEPVRVVRVMRGADRVKVKAFHCHRIEPHGLAIQGLAFRIVVIMPIDALDQHPPAVYKKHAVFNFYGSEPESRGGRLDTLALRTFECQHNGIKMWQLGGPEKRLFYRLVELG